jgi:hypothetical protein
MQSMRNPIIHLTMIAGDKIDWKLIQSEESLIAAYVMGEESNSVGLQLAFIDTFYNLKKMFSFLFRSETDIGKLVRNEYRQIFDFTPYKNQCRDEQYLDHNYQKWIKETGRENTMDEFGNLLCIIGFFRDYSDKKSVIIIAEQHRRHSD